MEFGGYLATETHHLIMELNMRQFVCDAWNGVMDAERNPLRHIPHLQTRHMILQILAWVWCTTFAQLVGSWYVFGYSAISTKAVFGYSYFLKSCLH